MLQGVEESTHEIQDGEEQVMNNPKQDREMQLHPLQTVEQPQPQRAQERKTELSHAVRTIKREEEHKAHILFAIIWAFLAFHTPRFVLNFEELLASRDYAGALLQRCNAHPFW